MANRLVLFANSFPYGSQEPYLMRELDFYGPFDEVIIFSLSIRKHQRGHVRHLPDDRFVVVPVFFRSRVIYAFWSISVVFTREVRLEIAELWKAKRLSFRRVVRVLAHYGRVKYEASRIEKYLKARVFSKTEDRTVLYSYRFLYQPLLMQKISSYFDKVLLIGRAHGIDLYEDRSPIGFLPGRSSNLESLDELHIVSEHGRAYLTRRYPEHAHKILATYLGTEDRGYQRSRKTSSVLRLVSCSNVVPVKRLELVVESLKIISREIDLEWVHYGDGSELAPIKSLAASIPDRIQIDMPGRVSNNDILAAYAKGRHDVFINVSSSEGLPVSVMEACSFGIPVIATDVGGTNEIVFDSVNGILLPANCNGLEVAEAIEVFARMTDEEYWKMSRAARQIWCDRFNSAKNYERFVAEALRKLSIQ